MTLAQRLLARIYPDDARYQCRADERCHRKDGHAGQCATFAVVLVEKAARWVRRLVG